MDNRGLLFIPDISGFSRFVTEIEINHSRSIIRELLEVLIEANSLDLEISEIEGDAILFFRYGDAPRMEELYEQVERMFVAFHQHLMAYHISRYCYCKACNSAIGLTLKVVSHYGEFTGYQVQNFNKLIGRDVIVAHQLLKNDIDRHEYWLVTDSLLQGDGPKYRPWMEWSMSTKTTEAGDIAYRYTQIGALKEALPPLKLEDLQLSDKMKMFSVSQEYDADIIPVFHAAGDFSFRDKWMEGVKAIEEIGHFLPRVGMRCRVRMDNGQVVLYSSNYAFHPDKIEFGETDAQKKTAQQYTLERTGQGKTRLTVDYYLQRNLLEVALFKLTRKHSVEQMYRKSLLNLAEVVREVASKLTDQRMSD